MQVGRHTGYSPGKNLTAFSYEFAEQIRILVIDSFKGDINSPAGHRPVCSSEIGPSFCVLRFHWLLHFAMQRMSSEKRVVFPFFQPPGRVRALLVPSRDIPRDRLSFGPCFSAFYRDNITRHSGYLVELLLVVRLGFLFVPLAPFLIRQTKKRGDGLTYARRLPLFFNLRLTLNREAGKRNRFQPGVRDRFT